MLDDDIKEIEAIREVIQCYDEAFNEWNIEKLVRAFHPESMVYWFVPERGGLISVMCYGWVRSFIENRKENPDLIFHVTAEEIHQKGTAAYARVRFLIDDPEGARDTTDYLTLIKFGSNWNVINKSGHTVDISKEELDKRLREKIEQPRNDPEEINLIKQALKTYADAFHEYDITKIEETFHPKMRVNRYNPKDDSFVNEFRPLALWKESFKKHIEDNITFDIKFGDIDQIGTAAIAIMKWIANTPRGIGDTLDFLTLLKIDGKWLIVNKTCDIKFKEKEEST